MREIKFRFWDTEYKHWVELPCLIGDYQANSYRTYGDPFPMSSFMHGEYQERLSDGILIIQQFTGLKDNNDKDIYEGDILKCKSYDGWFDKEGFYYNKVVEYTTQPAGESQLSGFLYIPIDREVIGNIFENPELVLKGT